MHVATPVKSHPRARRRHAGWLYMRHINEERAAAGLFPIPFKPRSAMAREQRRIMETLAGRGLFFRALDGVLPYGTALVSYRCGLRALPIGLDRRESDRVNRAAGLRRGQSLAVLGDFLPRITVPAGSRSASAQAGYSDGTALPVKFYRR